MAKFRISEKMGICETKQDFENIVEIRDQSEHFSVDLLAFLSKWGNSVDSQIFLEISLEKYIFG